MRALFLSFLALAACRTVGHTVDDLAKVHQSQEGALEHRYQFDRFGWMGGWLRYGPIGEMLGPWRYAKRSPDTVEDPAAFCAERIQELGASPPRRFEPWAESVYWTGKVLLRDPYALSRIFAAETLARLGEEEVTSESFDAALLKDLPEYKERIRLSIEKLTTLYQLRLQGKAEAQDAEAYRRSIAEIGAVRFDHPGESLEVARLFTKLRAGDAGEREALELATRHVLARAIPQLLWEGLRDPSEFVRETSLRSLHRLGGVRALSESLRVLSSETSPLVRRRLAQLCGELTLEDAARPKDRSALDFLGAAVRDPDGSVATSAMASLSRITGQKPRYDREYWKSWWENYLLRGSKP